MPEPLVNPRQPDGPQRAIGYGPEKRRSRYDARFWEEYGEDIQRAQQALAAVLWRDVPALREPGPDLEGAFDDMLAPYEQPEPEHPPSSASRSYASNSSTRDIAQDLCQWPSDGFLVKPPAELRKRAGTRKRNPRPAEPYPDQGYAIAASGTPEERKTKQGCVDRVKLLDGIRRFSRKRIGNCRRNPLGSSSIQLVRRDDGSCGIIGLESCASVHACPVCAAQICAHRADEVTTAATLWRAMRKQTYLLTLTIRHSDGDELSVMLKGLAKCWSKLWESRAGQALREHVSLEHYIRAFECTFADYPANGWHPHLHVLAFVNREYCESERQAIELEITERWKSIVLQVLGERFVPDDAHAIDLTLSTDAKYIVKLGLEVASIVTKKKHSSGEHRTTWQIAEDAARGDNASQGLWIDWGSASFRRKQLTWSRGTKKCFRVAERTDEQLCLFDEQQLSQGPAYVLRAYSADEWRRLAKTHRYWLTRVMCALQSDSPLTHVNALPGEPLPLERAGPGFVPLSGWTQRKERFKTKDTPVRHDTPDRMAEIRLREVQAA